jgi:hypothetical protein
MSSAMSVSSLARRVSMLAACVLATAVCSPNASACCLNIAVCLSNAASSRVKRSSVEGSTGADGARGGIDTNVCDQSCFTHLVEVALEGDTTC